MRFKLPAEVFDSFSIVVLIVFLTLEVNPAFEEILFQQTFSLLEELVCQPTPSHKVIAPETSSKRVSSILDHSIFGKDGALKFGIVHDSMD